MAYYTPKTRYGWKAMKNLQHQGHVAEYGNTKQPGSGIVDFFLDALVAGAEWLVDRVLERIKQRPPRR